MGIFPEFFSRKWFHTIRAKIAVSVSLLFSLISLFMFVFFPAKLEEQAIEAISVKARSIAEMTAFSISPALFFNDMEAMDAVIESAKQNADLAYMMVLDASRNVVAALNEDRARQVGFAHAQNGGHISPDGAIYETMIPIMLQRDREIGQLYLGLSLRVLKARIVRSRAAIASVCLVVLAIAMLAAFVISTLITGNLSKMVEAVEEISSGDLTRRAPVSSRDEVGHLANSFNLMVHNLEAAHSELETLNRGLEERVEERTKELQEEIGERKRTEEALKSSEGQLIAILESTDNGILVVSDLGQVIHSNKRFAEMWRIPDKLIREGSDEQLLNHVLEQLVSPDKFRSKVHDLYKSSETSFDTLYFKDNRVFERFSSPLVVETGIAGRVWSFRDVTERKKAEEERVELEARLQRAEKMEALGTLAGGVAHDLNNILSGIVSYPDLLLLSLPEGSELREPVLTIQKSGQRAAAVVQDLLTLARRGVPITEVCNLNEVIVDYLESPVYAELKMHHPDVQFETNIEGKLLNIMGSSVHLSKTIMNLASNAAEAMPDGGKITISTRNQYVDRPIKGYDSVEEGDYVVLTASDNGTGISEEDLGRIFEPFYTKKTMGRSGTGLGMAVVWGTVKDHRGYIDIESVEGKGTAFDLYFPVTRQELAGHEDPTSIEELMGNGETILVVDDVSEQREVAKGLLESLGYRVNTVAGGEEAVEYMKEGQADLVMLDMIMEPGIDGLETYKRIIELHPHQKAMIVSGFSETERVREAQALGAGQYVRKPYILDTLGTVMKAELSK